jgi:hypothetical protein
MAAENARLRASLLKQRARGTEIRRRLRKSERRVAELQAKCEGQEQTIRDLKSRPGREAALQRRLRMLEQELEQARAARDQHAGQEPLADAAASTVIPCRTTGSCRQTLPHSEAAAGVTEDAAAAIRQIGPCALEAMRVAVIGGLDRLERHYRRVVEGFGGDFLFHNGDCHAGCHSLRNAVWQSDLIVFITRVNSHSALQVVKGLCRRTGKQFLALRETSPSALKAVLVGAA